MPEAEAIPPLFIGGCGRSGTTMAVDLLGMHPLLSPIYETGFVLEVAHLLFSSPGISAFLVADQIQQLMEKWSRDLPFRPHDKKDYERYWHGAHYVLFDRDTALAATGALIDDLMTAEPQAGFRRFVVRLFVEHARQDGKPGWINKTPLYVLHLPLLKHLFPTMKFLHCMRDPRDAVPSMLSRRWGQHQTLDQAVRFWISCIEAARAFAAKWPQDYVETRLEDLVTQPEAEIARILQTFRLEDRSAEMLTRFRERVRLDPARIAGEDRDATISAEIERIAGPTMIALGYR
jgi:sulfotransferase family protein